MSWNRISWWIAVVGLCIRPIVGCSNARSTDQTTSPSKKTSTVAPKSTSKTAGTAGAGSTQPSGEGSDTSNKMPTGTTAPPTAGAPLAMDECGLHTSYPGDEYCILPPPADKGFQLHIGPN